MINYEWNIVDMERKAADGFVTTVHYTVSVIDGEYSASSYGTVGFTQEDKFYIRFEDLTKEQVVGWVQESLGKDEVEAGLTAQIDSQKNPVSESGLPW